MNIFEILFYQPLYNLIIVFYRLLGENLGLAIIAVGILSRAIFITLTNKQVKMAESNKEFSKKMKAVKKKYKNNKEKEKQELLKLQQEYLPAQLGGCLPMIFQFIVFINIYNIIRNLIGQGVTSFNDLAYSFVPTFAEGYTINTDFFGVFDLKQSANGVNEFPQILPYIILILLVGLTQWGSMKVMMALRSNDKEEEKKPKKKGEPEDFGEIFQQSTRQAMLLMPIVFMFLSFNLPSGLSIYLITTSTFVILQQLFMHRLRTRRQELGDGSQNVKVNRKK